jgi:hypothetical protein
LNSVDFPTLGRPIMAIVKDISDPSAFGAYFRKKRAAACVHVSAVKYAQIIE